MVKGLDIVAFLEEAETIPIIDVRTPAEFVHGHIPTAINIPLFSDEERKKVGTTFKNKGQKMAVLDGLEFVGPKMKNLASVAAGVAKNKQLLVHCWRGGLRSSSMAWLFNTVGIKSRILEGGYKSFRRHVLAFLEEDFSYIIIGGLTGSGKTDVLHSLKDSGEQVIDLENLAHHKGSAFGSLGEQPQPSNEQFENDIFWEMHRLDKRRPVWLEDESRNIGRNTLPAAIHRNIRSSPLIFLEISLSERIDRLVRDYAGFRKEDLIESVLKIRPRLGGQVAGRAVEAIKAGDYHKTAELVLNYYDKTYRYGLDKRERDLVFNLQLPKPDNSESRAAYILEFSAENRLKAKRI